MARAAPARSYRVPVIVNPDQGCRVTSAECAKPLSAASVKLSMDGKGRCLANVFASDCEEVYLKSYGSLVDALAQLDAYFHFKKSTGRAPPMRAARLAKCYCSTAPAAIMNARASADWPLPAASASAPVLGSGQLACPPHRNHLLVWRPSCPLRRGHFTFFARETPMLCLTSFGLLRPVIFRGLVHQNECLTLL